MFFKLVVVACSVAASQAAWTGPLAGGQPAALYPAGIDPKACPNFPNCENPAVALSGSPNAQAYNAAPAQQQWNAAPAQQQWNAAPAQPQWNSAPAQPQWNSAPAQQQWNAAPAQPQWNAAPAQQQWNAAPAHNQQEALNNGEYIGDGDYHGEGLQESGAFGQAQGGHQAYSAPAPAHNAGYAAPQAAAQVPAGVDAHSCPNYPFCN